MPLGNRANREGAKIGDVCLRSERGTGGRPSGRAAREHEGKGRQGRKLRLILAKKLNLAAVAALICSV